MKKSKYAISEYWRTKINQNELFWRGLFENKPINRESVIISPVILNSYSSQAESSWAVYPNPHSVLGFLQFIYLPTAFIGVILGDEMEYAYYFQENLKDVLFEYRDRFPEKDSLLTKMEDLFDEILELWKYDDQQCLEKLEQWTVRYNEDWAEMKGIALSFHVFASPKDVVNYMVSVYEEDLSIEFMEDDLGLTKEEFLNLGTDDIYQNDFLKRKFTDILTNRMSVTL